jgi:NAD(P)-dependent dehydrogenase (short-subunit alcohol dehydrogenase family)
MHTAIVTGATRGIGFDIAKALLKAGHRVMITGRSPESVSAALSQLAAAAGGAGTVAGTVADVRDKAAVEAMVAGTVARFGSFDTLINNAGVGLVFGGRADH